MTPTPDKPAGEALSEALACLSWIANLGYAGAPDIVMRNAAQKTLDHIAALPRTPPPVAMDEVAAVVEAVTERFAPVPEHLAQTWLKRARALLARLRDSSK